MLGGTQSNLAGSGIDLMATTAEQTHKSSPNAHQMLTQNISNDHRVLTCWFRSFLSQNLELHESSDFIVRAIMLVSSAFAYSTRLTPKVQIQSRASIAIVARRAGACFMGKLRTNISLPIFELLKPAQCGRQFTRWLYFIHFQQQIISSIISSIIKMFVTSDYLI